MKALLLLPFALLLFSGCMNMKTMEDCENMDPNDVLQHTSWGENVLHTDTTVVVKARVTCWHTAALGYTSKGDRSSAIQSCDSILLVPDGDAEVLYREYAICIDAVAKRFREPSICLDISADDFKFEKERCIEHATPPAGVCAATPFILLALAAFLFARGKKN
jgi:hypothetical protein